MKDFNKIRKDVSKAYASAVTEERGCCCGNKKKQKGRLVRSAGYDQADFEGLPEEVVQNAFGCGNPVAFSGIQEGDTVVDLGSGAGIDLFLAVKKTGPSGQVIGIDMTDEMIEKARDNIAKSNFDNIEVRKGLIEEMPVESGTVDWVISNCVINLSPEKPRLFKEIHRVLKPGGKMQVSDVVVDELPQWVRDNKNLYSSCVAGAIREDKYVAGLKEAGLTNVKVERYPAYTGSQIRELVASELCDPAQIDEFLSKPENQKLLEESETSLEGKIWSARIYAEKP